jgi:acyl dehydratase
MVIIKSLSELSTFKDKEIGVSPWHKVTQEQINRFADATLDHQWIHVDPERSQKESPFGTSIAHGFLTLSMAPFLMGEIFDVQHVGVWINYGLNKVRFSAHVPVNSKIRMRAKLLDFNQRESGAFINLQLTFELEGGTKPVCIAESLSLLKSK